MQVLLVDLSKYYGGADVRVLDLAQSLQGTYPYTVAVLRDSPLHQRLQAAQLNALPVPYGRSDPRLIPFLARVIRQQGFTVVDSHNPQSQFWGAWAGKLAGARLVSTVHSAYRLEHGGGLRGRAYEQVLRLNNALGGQFIAITEAVYDYLRSLAIPAESISLIHNSLKPPTVSGAGRSHELFHQLGWNESHQVLIHVGRLEPVKGQSFLVDAIAQIQPTYPQLRVLIVGDGRLRSALETQIAALGLAEVVHLAGFRQDIPELLAGSDVFCLPSLSEGLPYALLEATAFALPVVVSRVGGMAELLTHQQTGYLVTPENAKDLAEGLSWVLGHPAEAKQTGIAAHQLVKEKFNPARMIAATIKTYGGDA